MKLEEHIVKSSSGEYSRKVWLLNGAKGATQKLCLFLDAEYYLNKMDAVPMLIDLQASGAIPLATCLFVSHVNGEARHADYTCNPSYARFIAEDIVHWAKERNEGISEYDNLICGLSLSGLESAYLTLTCPELFPYALCQSGSFWWNKEWLLGQAKSLSNKRSRLWISVGDQERESGVSHQPTGMRQEVSQVDATENIVEELKLLGYGVSYHLFSGGHDTVPWKEELPSALKWLIGKA